MHSHRIESRDEVVANIRQALTVFSPEQIYVDPDCGLKTRSVQEAIDKLRVVAEATQVVRDHLANGTSRGKRPAKARRR